MKHKLHRLIKSLTKSEKRYFKLFSKHANGQAEKNYIKLFDAIEQQAIYDESKLIEELQAQKVNTNYLIGDKSYLYKLILKCLRNFHSFKTSRLKVGELLEYAIILMDKGLPELAADQLKKCKKIALEYHIISYLPEILSMERNIKAMDVKSHDDLHLQWQHDKDVLNALQVSNQMDFLYMHVNLVRQKLGKVRNEEELESYNSYFEHNLLKETSDNLPFFARLRYHKCWAAYYYSQNNKEKEYSENQSLISLMQGQKDFIKEYPLDYASTFSRLLILTKEVVPEDYAEVLTEFRNIPNKNHRQFREVKSLVEFLVYSTELVRMINKGAYDEALLLINPFENILRDYKDLLQEAFMMNSYYKFAYILIGLEKYSKALDYLNKVTFEFDEKTRKDTYRFAKIVTLIVHLELGNYNLLPYMARSVQHHFKRQDKLFQSEKLIVNFIGSIKPSLKYRNEWIKTLPKLRQKFVEIIKDPNERNVLQYFDFLVWMDSRIACKSFMEIKKRIIKSED